MITELLAYKIQSGVAFLVTGIASVIAVIDPSITSIVVASLSAVVAIATAYFSWRTATVVKAQDVKIGEQEVKVAEVVKTTDGMKTELVAATERAAKAEGELKARDAQQTITDAVARGVASVAAPIANPIGGVATPVTVVNEDSIPVEVVKKK